MDNEIVTGQGGVPVSAGEELRAEVVELTERIQVLSLERGTAVRMRNRALARAYRAGASFRELADLTGLHAEDIAEVISMPPDAYPR
jgi:hypothetical protein